MRVQHQIPKLEHALGELRKVVPKDQAEVLTQQGQLLAKEMIALTPVPRHIAKGGQLSHGRRTVKKYFDRAAPPADPDLWKSQPLKRIIRTRRIDIIRDKFSRIPSLRHFRIEPFNPDMVYSQMNKRGQVRRKVRGLMVVGGGRQQALAAASRSVGKAKGGWATGLGKLGSKAPGWVTRHRSEGQFRDGRKRRDPFIHFTNTSRWAGTKEAQRIRNSALRIRSQKVMRQARFLHNRRIRETAQKLR